MSKWSLLFLVIPIFGVAFFAVGPFVGWTLPEDVSAHGWEIDRLYYLILAVTGVLFVLTQLILVYVLWKFGRGTRGHKASYVHGNHKLEIFWTVTTAAVLGFVALAQLPAWIKVKFPQNRPPGVPAARVIARQFEWRIVYPGPDGRFDTVDDIQLPNELHVVQNRPTLIELRSMDVLHSFFLPHLRMKQDAVPGIEIPVWFTATKSTRDFQAEGAALDHLAVMNPGSLAVKLAQAKTPLAKFLRDHLADDAVASVTEYAQRVQADVEAERAKLTGAEGYVLAAAYYPPTSAWEGRLVDDLNRLLDKEIFSEASLLEGIRLSEATRANLAQKETLGERYQTLLNRQILSDAFPADIRPVRNYDLVCAELCGWGHYKMKGRLFVHENHQSLAARLEAARAEQERAAEQETSQ